MACLVSVGQAATYGSDFKDGANLKGLAASFFLFFACLAPAVAFGGLLGKATQGQVRRQCRCCGADGGWSCTRRHVY